MSFSRLMSGVVTDREISEIETEKTKQRNGIVIVW